jgi:hypothetical protein
MQYKTFVNDGLVAGTRCVLNGYHVAGGLDGTVLNIVDGTSAYGATVGTCTISNATPGVVTLNNHGFIEGDTVSFSSTGSLPAGFSTNTVYYVKYVDINTFQLSLNKGGASIATSSAGSGIHTVYRGPIVVFHIHLAATENQSIPWGQIPFNNGIYVDVSAGAVSGSIFFE